MPDSFNFNGTDVAQRWTKWRKTFETYFTAAELSSKPAKVQIAILLHAAGEEAQEIHSQFTFADTENAEDTKTVLDKFHSYCNPRQHSVYERYRFWMKEHIESEPIDKWVKDLKTLSTNCEFKDENDQLRDKIVFSYKDNKVKERMLRDQNLDLAKTLEICRAAESTKVQIKSMCNARESEVDIQELRHSRENSQERNNHRERNDTEGQFRCYNCTGFGHLSRDCPNGDSYPRGRSSSRRGRRNNRNNSRGGRGRSASFHRGRHNDRNNRSFHDMEEEPDPLAEFQTLSLSAVSVSSVNATKTVTKRYVPFEFYNNRAKFVDKADLKVDSGSEGNLMPIKTYCKLYPNRIGKDGRPLPEFVEENNATLTAYGGNVIGHLGKVTLPCSFKGHKFMADFYLSDADGPMLLGLPLGEELGIIKINVNSVENQHEEVPKVNNNKVSIIKPVVSVVTKASYVSRDIPFED